ncbi:MAG: hypothetical protein K8T10_11640 [Candidatus Eremiobacteraeota bacterium]|nr:hypothetical protein [Candidatus Eremiobacteraeota bacterium]
MDPINPGFVKDPYDMQENLKELMKQKLDPLLMDIVNQNPATVPIIIQTIDGLKDADREKVDGLGGKVKDDLYIINAFSADMSTDAIVELIKESRIIKVYYDAEVRAV